MDFHGPLSMLHLKYKMEKQLKSTQIVYLIIRKARQVSSIKHFKHHVAVTRCIGLVTRLRPLKRRVKFIENEHFESLQLYAFLFC